MIELGAYKYMKKTFIGEYKARPKIFKERVREWKKGNTVARAERPTNLARARALGYRAKAGYLIARVKIDKGMRKRPKTMGGRKPSKYGRFFSPKESHREIAEQKASRKFRNCEVLNSYWVGEDGQTKFFEIILLERDKTGVKELAKTRRGRAFRGLTSAGRKSRGLRAFRTRGQVDRS
ncbi:MAG: 50S ribosomal protein L15e [Candidatus Micrarchaeota archaeon]